MAYTDAQYEAIIQQLAGAYKTGERNIIRLIAEGRLDDYDATVARRTLAQIRITISDLGGVTQDWVRTHVPNLYRSGMNIADAAMGSRPLADLTVLHRESIQAVGENIALRMGDALVRVGRTTNDVFREAGLSALQQGTILGETRQQATVRMVADLQERGVAAFVDKSGRQWSLSSYSEMVVRTESLEAVNGGMINRMAERGDDLVYVSRHADACPLCVPWEGEILSISGQTEGYATLDEAREAGLEHPNCGHRLLPYNAEYATVEV